jgi:glycosyltransferase involved in cell wall biosynthesis
MGKIIFDCDLMRFRNSGLHHYCLNLGIYVQKIFEKEKKDKIAFYVPSSEAHLFGPDAHCILEKKWHRKFFNPFLWDCDIWHAPFQSGKIVPMKNKRIKVLLTIHDLNALHEPLREEDKRENLARTQKLIDRADAIVCISNHTKDDVINNMEVHNKPVHVIYNGTHDVATPPSKAEAYMPQRPFLFTMGYINRKKNFHTLVPLLSNPKLELVIAGKLDDEIYISGMKETAARLGASDRLHIVGPVSETDKAWYLKNCEAFCLPSLAEGFGAPVVEAMTFGRPIFLSSLTSLPEIGGDVSFYFKNFDPVHMHQVLEEGMQTYLKDNLKERIIKRAKEFSWEKSAKQYVEVYHSMLQK